MTQGIGLRAYAIRDTLHRIRDTAFGKSHRFAVRCGFLVGWRGILGIGWQGAQPFVVNNWGWLGVFGGEDEKKVENFEKNVDGVSITG